MIVVRLQHGLGNQLFQYACGRSLSLDRGVPLRFDTSFFLGPRPTRKLWTRHFAMAGEALTPLVRGLGEGAEYGVSLSKATVVFEENRRGYQGALFDMPGAHIYLVGFFQSEKYFAPHADQIREDLRIVDPPDDDRGLEARIRDANAVSVHVRRADYVGKRRYDLLTPRYYDAARERVRDAVEPPTFFVFSDDGDFCREQMATPDSVIVPPSGNPVADLRLMSLCRHHIIANSSFSWWGAWLGEHPDKRVFAPSQWFHPADVAPIDDVLPARWTRLEAC